MPGRSRRGRPTWIQSHRHPNGQYILSRFTLHLCIHHDLFSFSCAARLLKELMLYSLLFVKPTYIKSLIVYSSRHCGSNLNLFVGRRTAHLSGTYVNQYSLCIKTRCDCQHRRAIMKKVFSSVRPVTILILSALRIRSLFLMQALNKSLPCLTEPWNWNEIQRCLQLQLSCLLSSLKRFAVKALRLGKLS